MIKITHRVTGVTLLEIESWENANLRSANLRYADLSSADLSSADLSSTNLRYADLSYANLSSTNLRYANLRYADLRSANLRSANLSYADLSSADLSSADLSYADLRSANLSYSIGNGSIIISYQSKYKCVFFKNTIYIGCQSHTIDEWKSFSNSNILKMDGRTGLLWWQDNKELILAIHENYTKSLKCEDDNE